MSAGALRTQRYRERRARGVCVLRIAADEVLLTEALIAAGYLAESEAEAPAAVSAAASRVLETWALRWAEA